MMPNAVLGSFPVCLPPTVRRSRIDQDLVWLFVCLFTGGVGGGVTGPWDVMFTCIPHTLCIPKEKGSHFVKSQHGNGQTRRQCIRTCTPVIVLVTCGTVLWTRCMALVSLPPSLASCAPVVVLVTLGTVLWTRCIALVSLPSSLAPYSKHL